MSDVQNAIDALSAAVKPYNAAILALQAITGLPDLEAQVETVKGNLEDVTAMQAAQDQKKEELDKALAYHQSQVDAEVADLYKKLDQAKEDYASGSAELSDKFAADKKQLEDELDQVNNELAAKKAELDSLNDELKKKGAVNA